MKASVNSFGTFLETVQKRRAGKATGSAAADQLLQMLAAGDDRVAGLMDRAGIEVPALMRALSDLTEMKLVEVRGEQVSLTEAGREVAARAAHAG